MKKIDATWWRRVFEATDRILVLAPEERRAALELLGREEPVLAGEVHALLRDAGAASLMDDSATAFAAPIFDQAVRASPGDPPRTRFGPYRVTGEIGRGGMGTVYRAERADEQYQKLVAIKLLSSGGAIDARRVQRFLDERQILAALDHPDIARLVDGGLTTDGLPWFAMEFVEGVPIDRYCDDHALPIEERLDLFSRICAAVQYAHRNLVVHCDLKPANILVTADGRVRLLDFGIARLLGAPAGSELFSEERILTPLYASPEQIRGETVTTASDVYALGVLLHLLLVGRHPFEFSGSDVDLVNRAVLDQDLLLPSASLRQMEPSQAGHVATRRGTTSQLLRRRLEGDLDAIVTMALQKEPSNRYGTAEQLERDVRAHLAFRPVVALPGRRLHDARKFVRRHRTGVLAAFVVSVLVLSFGIATMVQSSHIRAQAERIALERDRAMQVSAFLRNAFASTDPMTLRRGITAQEILDSAAARIDAVFAEPEQRAQLMFEMAQAYDRLGFPRRARELLERSLAIQRALPRPRNVELAGTLHLLGAVLHRQGELAAAERAYVEALALRRRYTGSRHRDVARTLVGLAEVLRTGQRLPEAEQHAREAMAIDADRPADLARSTGALAAARLDAGDHDEAVRLYGRALALSRETYPEEHIEVAGAVFGLAAALRSAGDRAGADSLSRHGLELQQRLLLSPAIAAEAGVTVPVAPAPSDAVPGSPAPPPLPPDESWIVFTTDRDSPDPTGNLGGSAVYIMSADGAGQRRLTHDNDVAFFPAWSPDGAMIAFHSMRAGESNVIVMRADGSGQRNLTAAALGVGAQRPAWSPDGQRIAFQSLLRRDIYVIGLDGTGLVNISRHPATDQNPSWSPDGQRIAFASDRDGSDEIYVMNPDGRNVVRLTVNDRQDQRPSWSPDGRRIAFHSDRDGDQEIYVMNADGSDPVRLTSNPGIDGNPSWSPDGDRIAFHRRVLGHIQVHVMNADGSNPRRLTEPSGGAFSGFPSWRRRR